MTLWRSAGLSAVIAVACLLLLPLTHSGLGSCGPYGPLGMLSFGPMLLFPLAIVLAIAAAVREAVVRFRR